MNLWAEMPLMSYVWLPRMQLASQCLQGKGKELLPRVALWLHLPNARACSGLRRRDYLILRKMDSKKGFMRGVASR